MHFINAKSILTPRSMNIYRGCTHGCIYCDSRSRCYQFTHAFEDVEVKQNAPELLEATLRKKRKRCMIGTGSMGDPYLPAEKDLCLMRRCLEVIDRHSFGVSPLTKSDLILRDLDLLSRINRKAKAVVQMTLTTVDDELCRKIEPGVCPTSRRFEVLMACREAGIPTVVWFSPLLPFINDTVENVDGIVDYCVRAKVHAIICFGIGLTLREGNREYFYAALASINNQQFFHISDTEQHLLRYFYTYRSFLCVTSNVLLPYIKLAHYFSSQQALYYICLLSRHLHTHPLLCMLCLLQYTEQVKCDNPLS